MAGKVRAAFYLGEALLGWVGERATRLRTTSSSVVRECITFYIQQHAEEELERVVGERASRKRRRDMEMDGPKDMHDGAMRVVTIWDSIEKEKREFKRIGILTSQDYDRWIEMLEANREPLRKYEKGEVLVKKLDLLVSKLDKEKPKE